MRGMRGALRTARASISCRAMLTALLLLIATPAEVNQTVKVEGKSYRVLVRGDEVKVFQKALIAGQKVKG